MSTAAETGRPVLTQGEGNRSTAHLNLTRSLADFWTMLPEAPLPAVRTQLVAVRRPSVRRVRKPSTPVRRPIPFAGYDATEKGWK